MSETRIVLTVRQLLTILPIGLLLALSVIIVVLPVICHGPEQSPRRAVCKENLWQVGKALYAYTQDYGGYYPFSWQPAGGPSPVGDGGDNAAMAMTSIGSLYSQYLTSAKSFRCPSTEDEPSFMSTGVRMPSIPEGARKTLAGGWSLTASSFGYDCRISPKAVANHAVMADMDGTWQMNHDTPSQNHDGGQNILYMDGHVSWKQDNFCSNDPNDNIFIEDPWNADTDSYLIRMNSGLGKSFKGYPSLHYPRTEN